MAMRDYYTMLRKTAVMLNCQTDEGTKTDCNFLRSRKLQELIRKIAQL